MRLICPNCVAQYEVDENVIPPEGRDVQCANCGHNWFQDSVQMFSHQADVPSGSGDPDSDVPPELFNDLEGRLDTEFVGASTQTAPDPNDMEPEEARDDFQIEQEPEAPSSRLDQDVLDVLRSEAEYSSGEKPPAMAEAASEDTPEDDLIGDIQGILQETQDATPLADDPIATPASEIPQEIETTDLEQEPVEYSERPDEPEGVDDLDEIRRRIMELEAQEGDIEPYSTGVSEPEVEQEPVAHEASFEPIDDLGLEDIDIDEPEHNPEPAAPFAVEYAQPQNSDSPFSRPTASGARNTAAEHVASAAPEYPTEPEQDTSPSTGEPIYEENIPYEEHIPTPPTSPNHEVEAAIETLVAEQTDAQTATDRPRGKVAARAFPNVSDTTDELYGASQGHFEARKDMLPDVDELSSEIASEAENGSNEAQSSSKPATKPKGSFLKGFKYALLLCIVIGILYMLQPIIVEYVPQAEGFLNLITKLVNMVAELIRSIAALIQGMIG